MSIPANKFDEIEALVSALCDEQITPRQAARLEQLACESDEVRRFLLDYLQLHGELYWQYAAGTRETLPEPREATPVAIASRSSRLLRGPVAWLSRVTAASLALTTLAAGLLAVLLAVCIVPLLRTPQGESPPSESPVVARLSQTLGARWTDSDVAMAEGMELPAGAVLAMEEGLAQVDFTNGARVLLQGPARFQIDGSGAGSLVTGRLHARVPQRAAGFRIDTPAVTIVDRGTEFGVSVDSSRTSEVHVFAGSVEITAADAPAGGIEPRALRAPEAVRVRVAPGSRELHVESVEPDGGAFVRDFPAEQRVPGSVVALRTLVARHPKLIHHYTFEGATADERRRDKRGSLHLVRAVMSRGAGRDRLRWLNDRLNGGNTVLRPSRAARLGNAMGVGLQSEDVFHPPERMTVEMLLCFDGFEATGEEAIATAVATRAGRRDCGFLSVVVDAGQLACLFDAEAPWLSLIHI